MSVSAFPPLIILPRQNEMPWMMKRINSAGGSVTQISSEKKNHTHKQFNYSIFCLHILKIHNARQRPRRKSLVNTKLTGWQFSLVYFTLYNNGLQRERDRKEMAIILVVMREIGPGIRSNSRHVICELLPNIPADRMGDKQRLRAVDVRQC